MSDPSLMWDRVLAPDGTPQWRLMTPPPLLTPEDQAAALADIATHLGIAPRADGYWIPLPSSTPYAQHQDQQIWHRPLEGAFTAVQPTETWSAIVSNLGLVPLAPASPPPATPPLTPGRRRRPAPARPTAPTPPPAVEPVAGPMWVRPATLLTAAHEVRPLPTPTLTWHGNAWVRVSYPTEVKPGSGPWAGSRSFAATDLEQHPVSQAWLRHWLLPDSGTEPLGDGPDRSSLMRRSAVLARTALRAGQSLGPSVWSTLVVPGPLERWIQFRGLQMCGRTAAARPLRRQFQQYAAGTQIRLIAAVILSGPSKNIYRQDGGIDLDLLEPEHRALLDWLLATLPQWARRDRVFVKPGSPVAEHFARIARVDPTWAPKLDEAWLRVLEDVMDRPSVRASARAPRPAVVTDPDPRLPVKGLSHAQMVQCERVLQQWQGTRGGELDVAGVASHPVWQRYRAARRHYQAECSNLDHFAAHMAAASSLTPSGFGPGDWLAHAPVAPVWLQAHRTTGIGAPVAKQPRDGRTFLTIVPTAWGPQTQHHAPCDPAVLQHALDNPALSPADVSAWIYQWVRLRPVGNGSGMSQLLWRLACVASRMGVLDDPDLVAELSTVVPHANESASSSPTPLTVLGRRLLPPDFQAARDTLDLGVACLARAGEWDALAQRFASLRHEEPGATWALEIGQRLLLACAGSADQWMAQQAPLAPWLRSIGRDWGDEWSWARRRATAAAQHGMRLGIGQDGHGARRLWTPWMLLPERELRLQIVSHLAAGAPAMSQDASPQTDAPRAPRRTR